MTNSISTLGAIPRTRQSNNFDLLRFVFATLVVLGHSYFLCCQSTAEPLSKLSLNQSDFGSVSVDSFFIISGFLITASWLQTANFIQYIKKRVLRIYPAFIVVSLMCLLVFGPLLTISSHPYFHSIRVAAFVLHTLLLDKLDLPIFMHGSAASVQVDGSLWTIKIEFECYLLVAMLGLTGLLNKRVFILALSIITWIVYFTSSLHTGFLGGFRVTESTASHLRFFFYYLSGMSYYLYRDRVSYNLLAFGVSMVVACVFWSIRSVILI
jgi:peptidoglycan/LPS O-acetylase OafA/YrhL